MRCHDHGLASLKLGYNFLFKVRNDTLQSDSKRLGKVGSEHVVGILRVVGGVMRTALVDSRRRDVVAMTPDQDLIFAVFVGRFMFVTSL